MIATNDFCQGLIKQGQDSNYSSSRMRVMKHNWSATKQHLHLQSVAEISRHSVLSGDRIPQCGTSSGSRHKDTDQCLHCQVATKGLVVSKSLRTMTTTLLRSISYWKHSDYRQKEYCKTFNLAIFHLKLFWHPLFSHYCTTRIAHHYVNLRTVAVFAFLSSHCVTCHEIFSYSAFRCLYIQQSINLY